MDVAGTAQPCLLHSLAWEVSAPRERARAFTGQTEDVEAAEVDEELTVHVILPAVLERALHALFSLLTTED